MLADDRYMTAHEALANRRKCHADGGRQLRIPPKSAVTMRIQPNGANNSTRRVNDGRRRSLVPPLVRPSRRDCTSVPTITPATLRIFAGAKPLRIGLIDVTARRLEKPRAQLQTHTPFNRFAIAPVPPTRQGLLMAQSVQ